MHCEFRTNEGFLNSGEMQINLKTQTLAIERGMVLRRLARKKDVVVETEYRI
jgi:hypothetical protein